jgi:hypothetical protein
MEGVAPDYITNRFAELRQAIILFERLPLHPGKKADRQKAARLSVRASIFKSNSAC